VSWLISVGLAGAVGADQRMAGAARAAAAMTLLVAVMPPKRITRPLASRSTTSRCSCLGWALAGPAGVQDQQAVAPDQHQHHQEQADPEGPVLRRDRPRSGRACTLNDDRADHAAIQPAGAADHEHQQHVGASGRSRARRARRSRWSAPAARRPHRPAPRRCV
jgi:hypothetical protein